METKRRTGMVQHLSAGFRSKKVKPENVGWRTLLALAALLFWCRPLLADSYYTERLDDARAVYLTKDKFSVHGDGIADDSAALQEAMDRVQETHLQGILFLPPGRYRISKTIYIWPGIRVIGYGAKRPVFVWAQIRQVFKGALLTWFFSRVRGRNNPNPQAVSRWKRT